MFAVFYNFDNQDIIMNITKEQADQLNAVIKVEVQKDDYQSRVDEVLSDYRKKARLDGFRPGKVPMGMIKKMYYKPVLAEEVNKLVSESLFSYLQEENIRILGEPLAKKESTTDIDFDTDEEFTFEFEVGLSPEINLELTGKDKFPYYHIKIDNKELEEYKDNVAKRYGEFIPVDQAGDSELVKGDLRKVDDQGQPVEEGITAEDVSMSLDMMKDDKEKKKFNGVKAGDEVVFDVKKAYPNDAELASLLRINKDDVGLVEGDFKIAIKEVQKFEKASIDQELFDKIYGEGEVTGEEEFGEKLKQEMKRQYESESEYRFAIDVKEILLKKAKLELPEEFLKRWLLETNENVTQEKIDEEFEQYKDEFRWQLIKDHFVRQQDLKVSEEELVQTAMNVARSQFMQYGMGDVPDEYLKNYAQELLSKKEEARRISDRKLEEKVVAHVKNTAKMDEKEVSTEKFRKLFEK